MAKRFCSFLLVILCLILFLSSCGVNEDYFTLVEENEKLTKQVELQQAKLKVAWDELAAANQLNMDYFDRICELEGQVWELERLNVELMDILGW